MVSSGVAVALMIPRYWRLRYCLQTSLISTRQKSTAVVWAHRRLRSCVGTRARLTWISCAIAKSVFCHYTVRYLYVCACVSTHMLYIGVWKHACVFTSSPRDMRMRNFNNLGNAWVCPGLQAPVWATTPTSRSMFLYILHTNWVWS